MTVGTVGVAQSPADARREAEITALEAATVAAVTVVLARLLGRAADTLTAGWAWRDRDLSRWYTARQETAGQLRAIRVNLATTAERALTRAARLGARHAGAPLPDGHDPTADDLIRATLDTIDADVRGKLERAADHVLTGRIETPGQFADATDRIDAGRKEAATQVGTIVTRAVAGGTVATAEDAGIGLVWVAERDACGSCLSMAGSVRNEDGLFFPVTVYPPRPIPWMRDGVAAVPLHAHCRCHLRPDTAGLSEGLAREAARSVARGWSAYDSLPARLAALDVVLRKGGLPKTVLQRAADDRARGRFGRGALPRPQRPTPSGSRPRRTAA